MNKQDIICNLDLQIKSLLKEIASKKRILSELVMKRAELLNTKEAEK